MNILKKTRFFLWAWGLLCLSMTACNGTGGGVSPDASKAPLRENAIITYDILDDEGNSLIIKENNYYADSLTLRILTTDETIPLSYFVVGPDNLGKLYFSYTLFRNEQIFPSDDGVYKTLIRFLSIPRTDTLQIHYQKIPTAYGYEIEHTAAYINGDTVNSTRKNLIHITR